MTTGAPKAKRITETVEHLAARLQQVGRVPAKLETQGMIVLIGGPGPKIIRSKEWHGLGILHLVARLDDLTLGDVTHLSIRCHNGTVCQVRR